MALFSAAFRAEASKATPKIYPLVEIAFPNGTKYYSSASNPISSSSRGPYEPRVMSWGSVRVSCYERRHSVTADSMTITISDVDGGFSSILGAGHRIENSEATIYLASPNVDPADWFTAYVGVLSTWTHGTDKSWSLELMPPDLALKSMLPRRTLSLGDFPDMSVDAMGSYAPIILGKFDRSGIEYPNSGAITCIYIDTINWKYLVGVGELTVVAVYVANVFSSTHTVSVETINGITYTFITFPSDKGTSTVTADVEGLLASGGTVGVQNPVEAIKLLLNLFCFADWKSGTYTTGAPITTDDPSSEFRYRAAGAGYTCSIEVAEPKIGKNVINDVCESIGMDCHWTNTGELRFVYNNCNKCDDATVYSSNRITQGDLAPGTEPTFKFDASQQTETTMIGFGNFHGDVSRMQVDDPLAMAESTDEVQTTYGPSSLP